MIVWDWVLGGLIGVFRWGGLISEVVVRRISTVFTLCKKYLVPHNGVPVYRQHDNLACR